MFDLAVYSSAVQEILGPAEAGARLMPLAPGRELASQGLSLLRGTAAGELFDGDRPNSQEFAQCVRSALFLYFSALDESHKISQNIHNVTGSYLHGIMHRQEPDYSNSKYWFRKVGRHELFPTLREEGSRLRLRSQEVAATLQSQTEWNPYWFVDACEGAVRGHSSANETADLEVIQRLEWQLVFDYSYRRALSG